jgi:chromosomal replication initiator protein
MKPEEIKKTVCRYLSVPESAAESHSRKREFVQARQVGMYFMKKYTKMSVSSIARMYGGRDHSTALHAIQKVNDHMDVDKVYRKQIKEIERLVSLKSSYLELHCNELIGFDIR